jgi:PAS domain S-box-containing protein
MFGCTAEEALGTPIGRFIPARCRSTHDEHIRAFAETGTTNRKMGEYSALTGLRADGSEFPIEASISQAMLGDQKFFTVIMRNITERRQVEAERQKFVSLADNSLEFIGMCDMNFMPFYVNAAGMQLVGLDGLEQALQTPVTEFFFPEDQRFIVEEFFPRVLHEGNAVTDIRFRHFKTGAAIWMSYNVFYIKDLNGAAVGIATVSRDITARKLADEALQKSEERLQLAKNAAALGLYDHDLVNKVMHWDARICELWGVSSDARATFHTFASALHPDDRDAVKAAVVRSFDPRGNGEYFAEYRIIRRRDKQVVWIASFGQTTFANGRPVRLIGMVQDITARKQAEAELRLRERQNRFLADILENSDQPFASGCADGKVEYANLAFGRLTGYSRSKLLAMNWATELTPPEWRELDREKIKELYRDRRTIRYEKEYFRKDGGRVPVELQLEIAFDDENQPDRCYAFITDLTERKKAQALQHENELRRQMQETHRFHVARQTAAAIAHELNQPLTAVSSYADVALHMLQAGNEDRQNLLQVLEKCAAQGLRAGQVMRKLMTQLQKTEVSSEALDINRLVYHAFDSVKAERPLGDFSIVLDLAADISPVTANSQHIQKVLVDLLNNALDAMQFDATVDGTITVTTRAAVFNTAMAQVTVCDCGKGVQSSAELKTMFQPFYTTKPEGLGINLAISRSIVESFGGKIWAEQNAGPGLSVHFTLPFVS